MNDFNPMQMLFAEAVDTEVSSTWVDTSGLDKADVLVALINGAVIDGPFAMLFDVSHMPKIRKAEAEHLLETSFDNYFDYVAGRSLKVDLSNDDGFDAYLFDRDHGPGAAEKIIAKLRRSA